MRVLVTGGSGMLGTAVCAYFRSCGHDVIGAGTINFDITDRLETQSFIAQQKPDLVIHTAAYTDVDGCERDPDRAFRTNALGAWHVAQACQAIQATIVFISTDFVFDGAKDDAYTEFDRPNPLGVYGASKLAGEELVRSACYKHYIARTSWLFGDPGKCFPKTVLRLASTRTELKIVEDQVGSPTYVGDLSHAIAGLIEQPGYGTYHLANDGQCSWYEFAQAIIQDSGLVDVLIKPIRSHEWPSPTKRPANSVLRPYMNDLSGVPRLRHWRAALEAFLQKLKQQNPYA